MAETKGNIAATAKVFRKFAKEGDQQSKIEKKNKRKAHDDLERLHRLVLVRFWSSHLFRLGYLTEVIHTRKSVIWPNLGVQTVDWLNFEEGKCN